MTAAAGRAPKLKAASSGASKKSARSAQGSKLPDDRSALESYPVGCCVLIEVDVDGRGVPPAGSTAEGQCGSINSPIWHMIAYQIGGQGAPHCARMRIPPSAAGWNAGLEAARETPASVVVLGSCWPYRPTSPDVWSGGAVDESDPIAGASSDAGVGTGDGVMMFSHLRGPEDNQS